MRLYILKYGLFAYCRYRPAYKAFRTDSSFNFMVFFFVFFFQAIVLVFQTLGVEKSGYCGFITAISQFDGTPSGIVVGLFLLVIAISLAACTAGNVLLLTKVRETVQYNGSPLTVQFITKLLLFSDPFDLPQFRHDEHDESAGRIQHRLHSEPARAARCRQCHIGGR